MAKYGVTPEADAAEQPDAVGGVPLSPQERAQRADLLRQRDALGAGDAARGWARLRDKAPAYTWFNRIVAIRFMELRDYLPSRARMFSDEAGALRLAGASTRRSTWRSRAWTPRAWWS